eukprot:1009502-Pelagomonas_calceolata.AAC.1
MREELNSSDLYSYKTYMSHNIFDHHLHTFLQSSPCRTLDPWVANIFFIPVYTYAVEKKSANKDALYRSLRGILDAYPFWKRFQGSDHLMVTSVRHHTSDTFFTLFGTCMHATVELFDLPWCLKEKKMSCFWRVILVPYVVSNPMILDDSGEFSHRPKLLSFVGTPRTRNRASNKFRRDLFSLLMRENDTFVFMVKERHFGLPDVSRVHRSSIFCAIPPGDTPNTKRLYDALFSGCIPVILSDDIQLPFQFALNYDDFCVRLPASSVRDGSLLSRLRILSDTQISSFQQAGKVARENLELINKNVECPGGFRNLFIELMFRRLALAPFDFVRS